MASHSQEHDHDHDHDHSTLSEMDIRVRALETLLTQKATSTLLPSIASLKPMKPKLALTTAPKWSPRLGSNPTSKRGC